MRPRRDLDDDLDGLFGHEEAERRRVERAEMVARHRAREEAEQAQAAKRKAEFSAWSKRANDSFLLREYRAAGVEPVNVDESGAPRVGMQLLLKMGWTIEEIPGGERQLVRPPPQPKWEGPRDQDSLPERSNRETTDGNGKRGSGRGRGGKSTAGAKEEGKSR